MNTIVVLKASAYYTEYLKSFYSQYPDLDTISYDQQYQTVMAGCFGWFDIWKTYLERTGGIEVIEIVLNAEHLQKKWASEHGVRVGGGWVTGILEAQIKEYQPTVLFLNELGVLPQGFRARMKETYASIKLVLGWDGIAQHSSKQFEGCDMVLSGFKSTADFYSSCGFEGCFFPLAFDDRILQRLHVKPSMAHETTFVGSISTGKDFHNERLRFLAELSHRIPLEVWSALPDHWFVGKEQIVRLAKGKYQEYRDIAQLSRNHKSPVFGLAMYQVLADSKITLNYHIDATKGKAGNLRLFEATGVGACLLTDWKDNIEEYFVPDTEIVTYRSVDECVEKIIYLLQHEDERKKIAKAGQARTLKEHTYENRFNAFSEVLKKYC